MYTISRRHTIFGQRFIVIDAMGATVKHHRSHEQAAWHVFALNAAANHTAYLTRQTRAAHDAQWAGRC
jgi:hypothetical protein